MDFKTLLNRSIKWWYLVIVGIIILDLVTKAVFDGKEFELIPGVFSISGTVHNTGASYGMFSGKAFAQVMFILLAVVFASILVWIDMGYKKPIKKNVWYKLSFVLILGGLFGNLIDRVFLGYVRDFICLDFISFPVFNIADVALTCGCIAFIVYILFTNPFGTTKEKSDEVEVKEENNDKQSVKDNSTPAE